MADETTPPTPPTPPTVQEGKRPDPSEAATLLMVRDADGALATIDNADDDIATWRRNGFRIATAAEVKAEAKAMVRRVAEAKAAKIDAIIAGT